MDRILTHVGDPHFYPQRRDAARMRRALTPSAHVALTPSAHVALTPSARCRAHSVSMISMKACSLK
eukprot:1486037-Rhodomonas_salina.1